MHICPFHTSNLQRIQAFLNERWKPMWSLHDNHMRKLLCLVHKFHKHGRNPPLILFTNLEFAVSPLNFLGLSTIFFLNPIFFSIIWLILVRALAHAFALFSFFAFNLLACFAHSLLVNFIFPPLPRPLLPPLLPFAFFFTMME